MHTLDESLTSFDKQNPKYTNVEPHSYSLQKLLALSSFVKIPWVWHPQWPSYQVHNFWHNTSPYICLMVTLGLHLQIQAIG